MRAIERIGFDPVVRAETRVVAEVFGDVELGVGELVWREGGGSFLFEGPHGGFLGVFVRGRLSRVVRAIAMSERLLNLGVVVIGYA